LSKSAMDLFDLEGRVAIVTGGSGQLATGFAEALHSAGARLILADLETAGAEKTCERLDAGGTTAVALKADVSVRGEVRAMVDRTLQLFGRVDILVNNAGIACFSPFEMRTDEEFDRVLDVNLKGIFLCAQQSAAAMAASGGGVMINIGSIYGVVAADPRIYGRSGRNSSEVYAASKGGVVAITRYLSVYLAPKNIRVNCLSPGGVFNDQDPFLVEKYSEHTPMGRMATADDLKGAMLFLASDASRYVTGHNLVVDGGWTAW
jgi:NAD(P)-dependent dehydrogenase (short-subunit alcohol dehydrogenase family)